MLGMTRWTPWTELAGMHNDLDALFSRVIGDRMQTPTSDAFIPAADLGREGDTWKVSLALPGVAPDKVDIDIVGRTLRVRGERVSGSSTETFVNEIPYGRFERAIALPQDIDVRNVQAIYRHGILELTLPVAEAAKPYHVTVKAAPDNRQLQAA